MSLPDLGFRADNDNTRFRGGYPALYQLAKRDPDAALAVLHRLRDASCMHGIDDTDQPSGNDDIETHVAPDEPISMGEMAKPAQDGPDETWPEMLHEIGPANIHVLLRSAGGIAWPHIGEP